MTSNIHRYLRSIGDEQGQALVEYALILVLASIVGVIILSHIGAVPKDIFSQLDAIFDAAL